jgi:platelet-activating factor acetylhydrolase IB subunit alpha
MIAYLSANNLQHAAETLRQELHIGDHFDSATSKKYEGLLEKKWTSVVRLQKKVCAIARRPAFSQTSLCSLRGNQT